MKIADIIGNCKRSWRGEGGGAPLGSLDADQFLEMGPVLIQLPLFPKQ